MEPNPSQENKMSESTNGLNFFEDEYANTAGDGALAFVPSDTAEMYEVERFDSKSTSPSWT